MEGGCTHPLKHTSQKLFCLCPMGQNLETWLHLAMREVRNPVHSE